MLKYIIVAFHFFLLHVAISAATVFQPNPIQHEVQNPTKNELSVHEAISWNDLEVLRKLSESVTLDKDEGNMLLKRSIMRGWTNSISWLVKEGADPNAKDSKGNTPLHVAAMMDCAACIDAIMTSTAKVDLEAKNSKGYTPLWVAARLDKVEAIRGLAAYGADINLSGNTPLTNAAWRGTPATVEALLAAGADVNVANDLSYSPLVLAASHGNLQAVKILLRYDADVKYIDKDNRTARQEAEASNYPEVIKEMKKWKG